MNVFKIAVDDKHLDKDKLENVFAKVKAGRTFWLSVDEFFAFSQEGEYTWLEDNGDTVDINGGVLPEGVEVVDFDVWYEAVMVKLEGE